jgi:hypothetical protein
VDNNRTEIRKALITCLPYFVIIFFLGDLDKLLSTIHSRFGHPLLVLYLFIATVIIIALFINDAIEIKGNYKTSGPMAVVPLSIYILALANSFWSPVRISSEVFHSKIVHQAFRKQKFGHDIMKMRMDGSMDIRYPGFLGMTDWEYGHWSGRGDTFYLDYDRGGDTAAAKPDTLILAADGLLTPIGIPDDTLKIYRDRFFRMPASKKK